MSDNPAPTVSAIIPARDEEVNIARAVRSLALQPDIREIIVVDDQSQDRTSEILCRLKEQVAYLQTLRIETLPDGWLGKAYAASEGARLATGGWLLFTDADTDHFPGSLGTLLRRAESEQAALLSLSPGQRVETWWEKAVIPLVYVQLSRLYCFEDVNDPRSPAAAANGQYLLIRRSIYEIIGGHKAVRDEVLEDVELARKVKSTSGKLLFLPGSAYAETRMYRTFSEMWQGWTKNLFLLYGRSSARVLRAVLVLMLTAWLPAAASLGCLLLVLTTSSLAWTGVLGVCIAAYFVQHRSYSRRLETLGFPRCVAGYALLGAPLLCALLLNSLHAYRGGTVVWKGRTYPVKGTL